MRPADEPVCAPILRAAGHDARVFPPLGGAWNPLMAATLRQIGEAMAAAGWDVERGIAVLAGLARSGDAGPRRAEAALQRRPGSEGEKRQRG